jgi:flagellar basal-body rod modification protein FlgD
MEVNAVSQSNSASGSTAIANNDMGDMFLKLLMAQLKSQSPLDPLDPNHFVGQLAQFNSLNELIQIRQLLQDSLTPPNGGD